jgi:hypothetical protein
LETRTFARGRVKPSLSSIALLFFVLISNAQANGQFIVNLSTITPNTAGVQNVVQLAFSGFVGSVNSATVTVTLTPTGGEVRRLVRSPRIHPSCFPEANWS